jgi:hypothetical protein
MGISYQLRFLGFLQPPTVPPDPTGDSWRGLPGATGPQGPAGNLGTLPTSSVGLAPGTLWNNGGVVSVA